MGRTLPGAEEGHTGQHRASMGHRLTAFGNVSQSGSLLLRRTPHCPTRKNSVVNNQKLKNSTKNLMAQGVSLTPCRRN
jgi:hypothetical protein